MTEAANPRRQRRRAVRATLEAMCNLEDSTEDRGRYLAHVRASMDFMRVCVEEEERGAFTQEAARPPR